MTFFAENIAIIGGTLLNVKQMPEDMWWIAEGNDFALFIVDHRQSKATPDMISPYHITAAINPDGQQVSIGWDGFVNESRPGSPALMARGTPVSNRSRTKTSRPASPKAPPGAWRVMVFVTNNAEWSPRGASFITPWQCGGDPPRCDGHRQGN